MNSLVGFVNNTDLRCGHDGLSLIAKKQLGIDTRKLGRGEMIAFLNGAGTKIKVFAGGDIVAYFKPTDGRKIDPKMIADLPKYFGGPKVKFEMAVEKSLRTTFPKWFREQGHSYEKTKGRQVLEERGSYLAKGR